MLCNIVGSLPQRERLEMHQSIQQCLVAIDSNKQAHVVRIEANKMAFDHYVSPSWIVSSGPVWASASPEGPVSVETKRPRSAIVAGKATKRPSARSSRALRMWREGLRGGAARTHGARDPGSGSGARAG